MSCVFMCLLSWVCHVILISLSETASTERQELNGELWKITFFGYRPNFIVDSLFATRRFCYEVAALSWWEKKMAATLFAEVPTTSMVHKHNHKRHWKWVPVAIDSHCMQHHSLIYRMRRESISRTQSGWNRMVGRRTGSSSLRVWCSWEKSRRPSFGSNGPRPCRSKIQM